MILMPILFLLFLFVLRAGAALLGQRALATAQQGGEVVTPPRPVPR